MDLQTCFVKPLIQLYIHLVSLDPVFLCPATSQGSLAPHKDRKGCVDAQVIGRLCRPHKLKYTVFPWFSLKLSLQLENCSAVSRKFLVVIRSIVMDIHVAGISETVCYKHTSYCTFFVELGASSSVRCVSDW